MPASFVWQPGPNGGTPTNAANLNRLAVTADIGTAGTPTGDAVKAAIDAEGTAQGWAGANFAANGTIDAAPAIQAAIDAGAVRIDLNPGGTYLLNSPIFLDGTGRNQRVVIRGNGATIKLGSGLPTTAAFTPDATVQWAIFPGTNRSALSGSVVSCTDGTRSNSAATEPRLLLENAIVDGQAANRGLVFANQANCTIRGVTLTGARALLSWRQYADGGRIENCTHTSPYSTTDSYLMYGLGSGDDIQVDGCKADGSAGLVSLIGCDGAVISGPIGGTIRLTSSRAISIQSPHLETDLPSRPTGVSHIIVDRSHVVIDGGVFYMPQRSDLYSIQINDTAGEGHSDVVVRDTTFRTLMRTTNVDPKLNPGIYITAANNSTRVRAVRLGGTLAPPSSTLTVRSGALLLGSAVTAITTAIAAAGAAARLAQGTWELRRRAGAWELVDPNTPGAVASRALSAPAMNQVNTTGLGGMTGTLTNGTTYEYAAAMRDALGNWTTATAAASTAATTAGAVFLMIDVSTSPGELIIWRKAGTGVLTAPDAYVSFPVDTYQGRWYDTGANINGLPWIVTGVPVPNTVAASNTTRNAFQYFGVEFGVAGATGPAGTAATVAVGTTTTGSPGTNAAVTNSGTSSAATLNFTIPQGAVGATGPTGANGTNGTNGAISQVQSAGTNVTVRPTLNFTGAGVAVADDSANGRTTVTIASGGGGSAAVAPALVVPPSSVFATPSNLAWPAANNAFFTRFSLAGTRSYRYVNVALAAATGNYQVGVVALSGTDYLTYSRVMNSGVIAATTADIHLDLGSTSLAAGDYALFIWLDNTTTQLRLGSATAVTAARMSSEVAALTSGVPASGTLPAWNSSRYVGSFTLEAA